MNARDNIGTVLIIKEIAELVFCTWNKKSEVIPNIPLGATAAPKLYDLLGDFKQQPQSWASFVAKAINSLNCYFVLYS